MRSRAASTFISVLILAGLVFPAGVAAAEDDLEDLDAEMAREMAAFLDEAQTDFEEFRDERDRDFAEFLEEQWQEFDAFAGLVADRTPKPAKLPQLPMPQDAVEPAGREIDPPPVPAPAPFPSAAQDPPTAKPPPVPPPVKPAPTATSSPELPGSQRPVPDKAPATKPVAAKPTEDSVPAAVPAVPPLAPPTEPAVDFDFYGNPVRIPCAPPLRAGLAGAPGNQVIAAYWRDVSRADFPPMVEHLLLLREKLRLNDWGFYQLAMQTGEALHGSGNNATLFCWFLLCKSGYKAKVGYSGATVYLLVPTAQLLYGVPYYTLEGIRYYNFSSIENRAKPGRIYTYQEDYPGAEQAVRLQLEQPPAMRREVASRPLKFSYGGTNHEFSVTYNPNAIRFFASYPLTDLPVFFTAAMESDSERSLLAALAPLVAGKSETEAVNILLRFVQTAFAYKTDEEQFGREKYLFAEETLFFPYSDCEDRSILFSYLVRRLTGIEVVGLHYPGHIATAVRFSETVAGDRVEVGGVSYVICDPTFINADIGMAMPQFKNVAPEIIRIGI